MSQVGDLQMFKFNALQTSTAQSTLGAASSHPEVPRLAEATPATARDLISPEVLAGCIRLADAALISCLGLILATAYLGDYALSLAGPYPLTIAAMALVTIVVFDALALYDTSTIASLLRQFPRILAGWTAAFALLVAAVFFFKAGIEFSRAWIAAWFLAGLGALTCQRAVLAHMTRTWQREGRLYRRAIIFGSGDLARDAITQLEEDTAGDIRICGVFDERTGERAPTSLKGYQVQGNVQDLIEYARNSRIDLIILTLPISAQNRINRVLRELFQLPCDIKLPASATSVRFSPHTYSLIGNVPMIDLLEKPISAWGTLAKWLFDKVIALAALVLLAPVMAAVAAAIKLDSAGPIFFRQKRYGFNNELIEVFKFRSMHTNMCDANAAKLVTREDPRVTKVGRFIRKTSIDELPQLFNVLLGDLSLVGPRPHALSAKAADHLYDEVVEGYYARHKVKPGITGWAQINGWRGETDTAEKIQKRVEHDLQYIENWSLLLDLYILIKTPFALLKTENAY